MKLTTLIYDQYDELRVEQYSDGNTAVILHAPNHDEEPISVNLPEALHFPSEQPVFWADVNNCDQAINQLEKDGVIKRGATQAQSGFVTYPEYQLVNYQKTKKDDYMERLRTMMNEDYQTFIQALAQAVEDEAITAEEYQDWLNTDEPVLCNTLAKEYYSLRNTNRRTKS